MDSDLDFLSDYSENILGTNISNFDSDNDGIPDGWEIGYGLNPLNAKDALVDSDNDGLSNREEYEWLTDPTDADMDWS